MPARPTSHRVTVWRQLKKTGAVYLQQSVCVFP
ncbi:MAG: Chromate resistance protein ChrB, partial [Candidatus Dormibacteraceae bacterium]